MPPRWNVPRRLEDEDRIVVLDARPSEIAPNVGGDVPDQDFADLQTVFARPVRVAPPAQHMRNAGGYS